MAELTLELRPAAESADVEAINARIEAGAEPNAKNDAGNPALQRPAGARSEPSGGSVAKSGWLECPRDLHREGRTKICGVRIRAVR